jgi:ubiquitin-protein ligase E3 B
MADYHLNRKIERSASCFRKGFKSALFDHRWLTIFDEHELQQLLSGQDDEDDDGNFQDDVKSSSSSSTSTSSFASSSSLRSRVGIDIDDWMKHTVYDTDRSVGTSSISPSHRVIQWFWQAVRTFTPKQQRRLLRFVTAVRRPPHGGFQYLQPPFMIRIVPFVGSSV